jgi:hypothetical protein
MPRNGLLEILILYQLRKPPDDELLHFGRGIEQVIQIFLAIDYANDIFHVLVLG